MSSAINFFIEANLSLLVFGIIYYFLLRNDTDFRFNRLYLLGSTLLSLVIPLFRFNNFFDGVSSANIVGNMQTIILPALTIQGDGINTSGESSTLWQAPNLVGIGYIAIAIILLTIFAYQVYQILKFYKLKKSYMVRKEDHLLIMTDGQLPTFSFFKLLFFDNSTKLTEEERHKIIEHEKVHIKELHSIDIILLELTKIIFWINPVAWMYRKQIEDIHEYIADHRVVEKTDEHDYTSLLAKMALKKMSLSVGHHFNKSITLKRINMMKKQTNRIKTWKLATVIPLVLLIVFTFSCNDEVMNDVDEVMETAVQKEIPADLQKDFARLKEKNPDAEFVYMEFSAESEEAFQRLKPKLDEIDPATIGLINVNKEKMFIGVVINKNGPLEHISKSEILDDGTEIFTVSEVAPVPPGGDYTAYYAKVASQLLYPAQARKAGVEGKVYVQFVIQKDGELTDIKVVKGIGAGCDAAAMAAIASIPGWSAGQNKGQNINQRIILPVSFKLGNAEEKQESEG